MTQLSTTVTRALARVTVSVLAVAGSSMITACSPEVPVPAETAQERARAAVAVDLATLIDSRGLVVNPGDGRPRPLDLYASAWLLTLADEIGVATTPLDSRGIEDAVAEISDAASSVPVEWRAWAWLVVADHGGPGRDQARNALADPTAFVDIADLDDLAARLWVAAITELDEPGSSGYPGDLAGDIRTAIDEPEMTMSSARFLWQACDVLAIRCAAPRLSVAGMTMGDIADVFELSAAAELEASGLAVDGFDGDAVSLQAAEAFAQLPPGNDVVAERLAEILVSSGADTSPAKRYWESAQARRDPATGLFRQQVDYVGTIASTYAARVALGEDFGAFIEGQPTADTVRGLLAGDELGTLTRLQAIAILTPFGEEPEAEYRGEVEEASKALEGALVPAERAGVTADTLLVLQGLGVVPAGVIVDPVPAQGDTERLAAGIATCALSGLLANGDEILAFYAAYLDSIPDLILAEGPDSPAYLDRITLLDYLAVEPDAGWRDTVARDLATRVGCPATPHLVARGREGQLGCDVVLTSQVVNTNVGINVIGAGDD